MTPGEIQLEVQAQDLSTGEIASKIIPVQGHVCEIAYFSTGSITAVAGNPYIATGGISGWGWYDKTFPAYSTDPRVAVPGRGTVAGSTVPQSFALDINPRQAGEGYILVGQGFSKPITVLAAGANAPIIYSQPTKSTDIYLPYSYQVMASSPLGKALTYSYSFANNRVGMTINAQTGALAWAPGVDQVGEHIVQLTVSDGTLSTYQHYRLQVYAEAGPRVGPVDVSGQSGALIAWKPVITGNLTTPVSCRISTPPVNGSATVMSDCSSGTYISQPGFIGTDTFAYLANDDRLDSNPGIVTVAVTDPTEDSACTLLYPVSRLTQAGKQGTLTIIFTGHIVSNTNKVAKVCPGTKLKYAAISTQGPVVCRVKSNTTSGNGSLRINDHIKCTDKPAGTDKIHFKIKSGVSK